MAGDGTHSTELAPSAVKRGRRRRRWRSVALVLTGLLVTGGAYALLRASPANAERSRWRASQSISEGKKLFAANCATCHGLDAAGHQRPARR